MASYRVLFVCLGNICRSPTAEGVFSAVIDERGLSARVEVDSAGTAGWHEGNRADERMRRAAKDRGYRLLSRARRVVDADFLRFDRILAMDRENLEDLRHRCPAEHQHKLGLFRSYDEEGADPDTPDPYYGGPEGFDQVVTIVERCSRRLADAVEAELDA